jgi:hypothetical protein
MYICRERPLSHTACYTRQHVSNVVTSDPLLTVNTTTRRCAESSVTDDVGGELNPASADEEEDEDSDAAEFRASDDTRRPLLAPRWPTRVFAAQCVRRVIDMCAASPHAAAHFDLAKARQTHLTRSRGGKNEISIKS